MARFGQLSLSLGLFPCWHRAKESRTRISERRPPRFGFRSNKVPFYVWGLGALQDFQLWGCQWSSPMGHCRGNPIKLFRKPWYNQACPRWVRPAPKMVGSMAYCSELKNLLVPHHLGDKYPKGAGRYWEVSSLSASSSCVHVTLFLPEGVHYVETV